MIADAVRPWAPAIGDRPERPFVEADVSLDTVTFRMHRLLVAYVTATETPDPLVVEDVALHILHRVVRRAAERRNGERRSRSAATAAAHRHAVAAARERIVARLFEPLRLKEIAASAGMAPSHLCGVFRRETGRSVHGYVRELRLRAAHDLLPDFRGRLADLALEVGFCHASHFSEAFRQHFGESPSPAGARIRAGDPGAILDALARLEGAGRGPGGGRNCLTG